MLLQKEISPVLEAIIMKCADSNRLVDFLGGERHRFLHYLGRKVNSGILITNVPTKGICSKYRFSLYCFC